MKKISIASDAIIIKKRGGSVSKIKESVFTEAACPPDTLLAQAEDTSEKDAKRAAKNGNLFKEAAADEAQWEKNRAQDRQIGLLIGPKNLEKLRAFGYDAVMVNQDRSPLTPGVAHRGMTE